MAISGLIGVLATGCAAQRDGPSAERVRSQGGVERYTDRAIRSQPEGFILIPSQRAERVYELPRLNEIARNMRQPAAVCFLNRAIETMKRGEVDGEGAYVGVPDGQIKIRARVAADGSVVRTEVLDSGFEDEAMEPCLQKVIEKQKWPPNETGHTHYMDIVYWVGLGAASDTNPAELEKQLRREQAGAGIRARQCLRGRVQPGHYEVDGLNLMDREGNTLVNRVEGTTTLPREVSGCVAQALKTIRIPRDPGSFVRPVSPRIEFDVAPDGDIVVKDEKWLTLIEAEERAARDARRAELEKPSVPKGAPAGGEAGAPPPPVEPSSPAPAGPAEASPLPPTAPMPRPRSTENPASGGLKLDLRGHRDDD